MPRHSAGHALGKLVHEECSAVIAGLRGRKALHTRVHEARKAIRRARALLALAEDGDAAFDIGPADRILQRVGDSLSRLRDAHVAIDTARLVGKQTETKRWRPVVIALRARSAGLIAHELERDPGLARRVSTVEGALHYLDALPWAELTAAQIRAGLQRQHRRVERAARRAGKHPDADRLHTWRRKVRRLRMQVEALPKLKPHWSKSTPSAPKSKSLHKLSDALGREQDLQVLAGLLRRLPGLDDRAARRAELDALIAASAANAANSN
ncbi:MAG TPA: CHAD domain-containing protein [Stenotrophomonas sp.]|nr:CHAD domain-containing protein [Stenotrophomonas sp.]